MPSVANVTDILRSCYSHVEVAGRSGARGVGVTNLKRLFGRPRELRLVVEALAATGGEGEGVASKETRRPPLAGGGGASTDTGSSPLAAVVAFELSLPAVFVRDSDLSGERLRPGTRVHLIDDL